MAQTWRTVRVFISSTFRDMHAERDHLVRVVFPELKERCRQRHIQLIDVDLRWGVTEKQAEGGGALDICLDEIDSCRPFFLGLLGYRYGSTPPGQEHSITAQEIYHGVLHNYLPRQIVDLRPIVEGILEGRTLLKEQVSCLVRCYQWDANKSKYLLQEDAKPKDKEMLHSIFAGYSIYQRDRSFFFFRSQSLTEELRERSESKVEDYFETGEAAKDKLEVLKQDITDAELPNFEYSDLETFGQMVLDTLWKRIDAEFPEERALEERDWLQEEAEFHELFIADRTRRFVGRSDLLSQMHAFVEKDSDPRTLVITGEPGCGKSALMARFTEEVGKDHPDWLILSHFVGASPSSTSLRRTLRRFCTHLNRALGVTEEVPEDYKELAQLFPNLLEKASENRRVLLIIDAVNQFEKTDNPQSMIWLPQALPENMSVVVSTLAGEALDALSARRIQPHFEKVSGLTEPEIKELVTKYLTEIRHEFPTEETSKAFHEKIKAGNPLYILVALEELRVFPIYEQLGKRVAELPGSVPELFDQVLERVESDFSQPLVQDFMSFVACGRHGMTAEELQTLLKGHSPVVDPASPPQKLPDMLFARLRRALGAYLFERSGVIDFFHGQLKEAVGKRYLSEAPEREKTHQIIAEYFEQRWAEPYLRALDELPHQLTKAKDWEGVERVLCDLHFIEAKCGVGMTYDLVADYSAALDALPEAQEEREHVALVRKYTKDLIAYAKGEIKHLDIIPSVEPWSEKRIRKDTERIINKPTRLDRMRAFSQFVNSESHALVRFSSHPGFTIQQAYNSASSGPVASAAEIIINAGVDSVLLLRQSDQRPDYNPHPTLLRTLEGHTDLVEIMSVTPDGKRAVSGSVDKTLRVWDLDTGQCLRVLKVHKPFVSDVHVTADGKRAVSRGDDHTLRVWDLESDKCLRTLEGHTAGVTSVSITPDGSRAISGSKDKTLRVWDIESGECLRTLEGYTDEVWEVSITADGKRAVSQSGSSETLQLWDLDTGQCLRVLQGHEDFIWGCTISVTPDGSRAVSATSGKTVKVWDLKSGKCLKTLEGHTNDVYSVSVTPDGKRAVSGSRDRTLRVWDLKSGECLRTFEGHTDIITGVSVTADGKRAVSASLDKTLRLWDVESGQCLEMLKEHKFFDKALSLTPGGKRIVVRGDDGMVRLLDRKTQKCLKVLKGHRDSIESVSVTPDGKRAVSGSDDETARVWDLDTGQCLRVLKGHKPFVRDVRVIADGKRAVSAGSDNTVKVWDLKSGKCLKTLEGHTADVYSVSVTPDGKRAVSGSDDETARVWDLGTGQCLRVLQGHTDIIKSVSVTPDSRRAVSASLDKTVRVWDIDSGECIASYQAGSKVDSVSEIRAGGRLAFDTWAGEVIRLTPRNFLIEPLIATPIRIWLYGEEESSGQWDNLITAVCWWCGQRFTVSDEILDVIAAITRDANLSSDQSPCLELPSGAWDEPRLLSECPLCGKPLKFNPFIVDNSER